MSRPDRDAWGLALARVVASRATCVRRSVGAVLVDYRGRVLATGYNGVASGLPHCNEPTSYGEPPLGSSPEEVAWWRDRPNYGNACKGAGAPSGTALDACEAIHAEANALLQCRDVDAVHTVYSTTAPCVGCTKLLLGSGARRIVYEEEYSSPGRELWERSGREWTKKGGAAPGS